MRKWLDTLNRPIPRALMRVIVIALFLPLLLIILMPEYAELLEGPFLLAVGWVKFASEIGPRVSVRWDLAITGLIFTGIFIVGIHSFISWLVRAIRQPVTLQAADIPGQQPAVRPVWRWRWTLAWFLVALFMFVAGIGMLGIVHQVTWLIKSPVPLTQTVGTGPIERAYRIRCASNLRAIGQVLLLYAQDNAGKFPDDLPTLVRAEELNGAVFVCPSSNAEEAPGANTQEVAANVALPKHCSYNYLGKGYSARISLNRVVAVEYFNNHEHEGMNVLYGDGHVEWDDQKQAAALLAKLGLDDKGQPTSQPTTRR